MREGAAADTCIVPDEGDQYFAYREPSENSNITVDYAVVSDGAHLLAAVWPLAGGVDQRTVSVFRDSTGIKVR